MRKLDFGENKRKSCLDGSLTLIYKKRLLLRYIHFKSDLINNMDHMRTMGTDPLSVIPNQTKYCKS